jgi:regulator of protease activity HflC (stomatin/prohibitin superfamily)
MSNNQLNFPKLGLPIIFAVIIVIIFFSKSFVTVEAGEAGVLWKRFAGGVVIDEPALGEGFHVVAPWNKVYIYEVRQQELFEKMKVLSSNGLEIQIDASAWYLPVYKDLGNLHQSLGENYLDRVIKPAIRSAARSVVGRYLPDELYSTKRDAIQVEIFQETKKILEKQYVQLNEVLVRDVTLPNTIKDAIERKLKQEQESLEYEFRLVTAAKDAEKVIIEATLELAKSPNSKVVVIGSGKDGMPLILGDNK